MMFLSLAICGIFWFSTLELSAACGSEDNYNRCPPGFWMIPSSDSCYKLFTLDGLNHWEDRWKYCQNVGPSGRLAFIDTKEKADDFVELLTEIDVNRDLTRRANSPVIFGLKRDFESNSSPFVWTDGKWKTNMTFSSWLVGEPSYYTNEFCVSGWFNYEKRKMEWNNVKCHKLTSAHRFLCEIFPKKWCPKGFFNLPSSDSCYKVFSVEGKPSWEERLQFCKTIGPNGRLAFIDTAEKSEELAVEMSVLDVNKEHESRSYFPLIIGLKRDKNDCSSSFVWTDGNFTEPMTFKSFLDGQPSCTGNREHCVITWFNYAQKKTIWNDVRCDVFSNDHKVLCEIMPSNSALPGNQGSAE